jgi:hypothetical protein
MYYIRELRPTYGFHLETERIFLEVSAGSTAVMELTKVRDLSITDLPADGDGNGIIHIVQTGQIAPTGFYIGGIILLVIAFAAAGFAAWEFIVLRESKKRALLRELGGGSHG